MKTASTMNVTIQKISKADSKKPVLLVSEPLRATGWTAISIDTIVNHTAVNVNGSKGKKAATVLLKPSGLYCGWNPWHQVRRYFNRLEDAAEYAKDKN